MTAELELFHYGDAAVRRIEIDGQRWAVAADICAVLEIRDTSAAVTRLPKEDRLTIRRSDTPGSNRGIWEGVAPQVQALILVSEDGATDLVLESRKLEAKAFRRWLTHEVWPAIRETGSYGSAPALHGPELLAAAVVEAQQMIVAKDARINELSRKVEADALKVNYIELYVADSDLLRLRTVAASLGVQETWLRELLIAKGWIYAETDTRWSNSKERKETVIRYSAYAEKKRYFRPVEVHEAPRFKGEVMHTLKVTPVGAEAVARLVAKELAAESAQVDGGGEISGASDLPVVEDGGAA